MKLQFYEEFVGFIVQENQLTAEDFIRLSQACGWGANRVYDLNKVSEALQRTSLTVTISIQSNELVACARAFSDQMFMTFIPDIFVDPRYRKQGLGSLLLDRIKELYPETSFFLGSQAGNDDFFLKNGFEKSIQSYAWRKS